MGEGYMLRWVEPHRWMIPCIKLTNSNRDFTEHHDFRHIEVDIQVASVETRLACHMHSVAEFMSSANTSLERWSVRFGTRIYIGLNFCCGCNEVSGTNFLNAGIIKTCMLHKSYSYISIFTFATTTSLYCWILYQCHHYNIIASHVSIVTWYH